MQRIALFSLFILLFCLPAHAADGNAAYYRKALAAVASGNPDMAESLAARGPDPVLNKVIRGYAMALPGNDYSFEQMNSFIQANPDWPGLKGIQMIAEQKIPSSASLPRIISWFSARPPLTLVGFYRYIDALDESGYAETAQKAIRARWVEGEFSFDEQTAFLARFNTLLRAEDVWARTDRMLWKNDQTQVRRMLPYLSATDRAVANARMAFVNQDNVNWWLSQVPADALNDPGLLYQRLKWRVKNNLDDDAYEILLNAPTDLGNAEAWWDQRNIMVRRSIERHDYAMAYRLASRHGQTDAKSMTQAEFISGFLALRFLNRPDVALRHFQILYDTASTPITRARGAYWRGRAYEAQDQKDEAAQAYQEAAAFSTTFYGQLAITRIYSSPLLIAKADPAQPEDVRKAFFARDNIRAIERLAAIGEMDRAKTFFRVAADNATKRFEFILLTDIAGRIHRPDLGIQAVKAANQKNIFVLNGGFPLVSMRVPTPPEPALTHALIRQESTFNPDASSSAGARGLMQLMPRTAKDVCRKLGIRYTDRLLDDPAQNIRLGTSFISQQIDRFDGSYILALAGYNAGSGRVRDWIDLFGDPRTDDVDPVDWIELIPIQETRNYVQRIIENLQVYRSKLSGGQARLAIMTDLKR